MTNAVPKPEAPAQNVRSHSGKVVHRGKWVRVYGSRWSEVPACQNSNRLLVTGYPTAADVTCKRCAAKEH